MIKITVISEKSAGYKNEDLSIMVPESGELCEFIHNKDVPSFLKIRGEIPDIGPGTGTLYENNMGSYQLLLHKKPEITIFDEYLFCFSDRFNKPAKATTFSEYLGASNRDPVRYFPAVEVYPFYMIWINERIEWVGIKFHYCGCDSELDGTTEDIETAGPYKLGPRCAELIRQAYKSQIPCEKILYTSPYEL